MSTELWICASIVFSLLLAIMGWAVQVVLIRDKAARDNRLRDIEDRLNTARFELVQLREKLQAASLLSLLFELTANKVDSETLNDVLLEQLLEGIEKLPTSIQLEDRIDGLEKTLSEISKNLRRLSHARIVCADEACGPES